MRPPKKGLLLFFCKGCASFFEVKQRWAPFLPGLCLDSDFARIFREFAQIFRESDQILRDFARIFNKSKLLWVRLYPLHPRLLHHLGT